MFSVAYAECWYAVCQALPGIRFWIPTRSWQQPKSPLPVFDPLLNTLRKLAALPNVTVRPSALDFGDVRQWLRAFTRAALPQCPMALRARQCPAPQQGGNCGDCRMCWDAKETAVSYCRH